MKIAFHHSDKDREIRLANAFLEGAAARGHEIEFRRLSPWQQIGDCDLACMVGVKSAELWHRTRASGSRTLMFDKGYVRRPGAGCEWEYWRVSLDAHHPTQTTLMREAMPSDRFDALDLRVTEWRDNPEGPVLFAGSSAKYHRFYGLPDPTRYAKGIIGKLRRKTRREIYYRPKPSWRDAVPIPGTVYSGPKDKLGPLVNSAHAVVTHGSNICFETILSGVPCLVLGDAIAAPVSSTELSKIERIRRCDPDTRSQWLANLAYHQWAESEMRTGQAVRQVERWMG